MHNFLHDLSNKLAIISGNIRKMSDDVPQKTTLKEATDYAVHLLTNFKRSMAHEEEILALSSEKAPIDIFFSSLESMHGVKIESALESTASNVSLAIKPAEIMRLMDNLVENAKNAGATLVRITDKVYGNVLCTEISDNGRGMSEEELARVGFNFSSNKDEGHGKGSTQLRALVESNGGTLDWKSEGQGKGTTVRMRLPASKAA